MKFVSEQVGPRQPWVTSYQRRGFGGSSYRSGPGGGFCSNHYTDSSQAHFTASQVQFILNKKPELKENKNCRRLYLELRKHFGIKQKYSELIMLCKNCRYLPFRACLQFVIYLYLGVFSGHPTATLVLPVPIPMMLQYHSLRRPSCLSLTSRLAALIDSCRIHSVQTSCLFRNRGNQPL